ncbi:MULTISPECIES: PEP-CTERM sorting domain-containing protein [unclassified Okeania]
MTRSVPEPTVLFGLGVVTAGLVTSRRQKKS